MLRVGGAIPSSSSPSTREASSSTKWSSREEKLLSLTVTLSLASGAGEAPDRPRAPALSIIFAFYFLLYFDLCKAQRRRPAYPFPTEASVGEFSLWKRLQLAFHCRCDSQATRDRAAKPRRRDGRWDKQNDSNCSDFRSILLPPMSKQHKSHFRRIASLPCQPQAVLVPVLAFGSSHSPRVPPVPVPIKKSAHLELLCVPRGPMVH